MAKETIEVTFDGKGGSTVAVTGVKGAGCQELTKSLEEALGSVVSDEATPEMEEREVETYEHSYR